LLDPFGDGPFLGAGQLFGVSDRVEIGGFPVFAAGELQELGLGPGWSLGGSVVSIGVRRKGAGKGEDRGECGRFYVMGNSNNTSSVCSFSISTIPT
jgi:hypothetical protein